MEDEKDQAVDQSQHDMWVCMTERVWWAGSGEGWGSVLCRSINVTVYSFTSSVQIFSSLNFPTLLLPPTSFYWTALSISFDNSATLQSVSPYASIFPQTSQNITHNSTLVHNDSIQSKDSHTRTHRHWDNDSTIFVIHSHTCSKPHALLQKSFELRKVQGSNLWTRGGFRVRVASGWQAGREGRRQ